jgi:hypothetical protein
MKPAGRKQIRHGLVFAAGRSFQFQNINGDLALSLEAVDQVEAIAPAHLTGAGAAFWEE